MVELPDKFTCQYNNSLFKFDFIIISNGYKYKTSIKIMNAIEYCNYLDINIKKSNKKDFIQIIEGFIFSKQEAIELNKYMSKILDNFLLE